MKVSIKIPDNSLPVTYEEALQLYNEGKRVLAALSKGDWVYAAHAFSKEWDNLDKQSAEFKEYARHGKWYLITQ
jgi:hypothetical protein